MKHLVPGIVIQHGDRVEFRYNDKDRKGVVYDVCGKDYFTIEHDDETFKNYKFDKVQGRVYILI